MEREINGKTYTFRMTRNTVRAAERAGMRAGSLADTPVQSLYFLWFASISQHQPMPISKSDALLDDYLDSKDCSESFEDLFAELTEEYTSVLHIATE